MSGISGYYYDGRSSTRHSVMLECDGATLLIRGDGIEVRYPFAEVKITPALAGVQRSLHLPKGAMCQLAREEEWTALLARKKESAPQRMLVRWERSVPLALVALMLTFGAIGLFIGKVIPIAVRHVALAVNPASEEHVGTETLRQLDRLYLGKSKLSPARQREMRALLTRMQATFADGRKYRLEFRDGRAIGANAFALPGGTIVITDAMVKLAKNDDEIAGVLAHEAGHVRNRHALRHILQSSGAAIVIAAITGDISSITSLAATLPATLVNASYSREFEYEADDAAVAYLRKAGVPPKVYADILGRLEGVHGDRDKKEPERRFTFFDDHPRTADRIRRVTAAQ